MAAISTGLPLATDTTPLTSCGICASSSGVGQQAPRNDDALNLVGALVDLGDLGVPEVPLHREVLDVAIPAEELDAVGRDLHGRVRRQALGHGADLGQLTAHIALVDQRRGPVHE